MAYFTVNDALDFLQTYPSSNSAITLRSDAGILSGDTKKEKRRKMAELLSSVNRAIANREMEAATPLGTYSHIHVGKWARPWNVARSLRNIRAPEGDHLVGVEIEMGFISIDEARRVAREVIKWRNVALDYEGGRYPIEATFPPIPAKKLTTKSKVGRYMKLLSGAAVEAHGPHISVGIHINVSDSRSNEISAERLSLMNQLMSNHLHRHEREKYFGRERVYGWMYLRADNAQGSRFIECKMFNSTTNWKQLKRYVNVATALYDLLVGSEELTIEVIRATLEAAHAKRV